MLRTFDLLKIKIDAREECLVRFFREKTGIHSIPPGKQLWSLCNKQSRRPHSEINQLVSAGLISKEQYYGVDRDIRNIQKNSKNHPQAHWFHGEWDVVLRKNKDQFTPAIIFLDSTSMAETEGIIQSTHNTMLQSPPGTFLFVNVMLTNPYDHLKTILPTRFIDQLAGIMQADLFEQWTYFKQCFVYNATGYTRMATYPFLRNT
jgi:hypothetical protein